MNDLTNSLNELVENLKKERDELLVHLHLAKLDFRDQWEVVEGKWRNLEEKLEDVGHETAESTEQVAHEIAEAYRRLRDVLKK